MEKHSMRHLLWTALFLLYCSCGCLAAVVQQLPQKGQNALQAYTVSTGAKTGEEWKPIRIGVFTKYVEDLMKYCNGENKGSLPDYRFNPADVEPKFKQHCSGDNKMTTSRMNTLFKEVLPEAIKLHRDRLKVKPVQNNLILWKQEYDEDPKDKLARNCNGFKMPEEHFKEGIPNVDFMLYVVLEQWHEKGFVCTYDKNNQNRATSARVSFIPKEIKATRQYIRLAARQIAIGLGFEKIVGFSVRSKHITIPLNGGWKLITEVTGNTLQQKMNERYKCSRFEGLISHHEGTIVHSEWGRRIAKDELMSQYTGEPTGMFYTNLTLAVFDAVDFYQANFSMAEPMSWGNQSECGLFQDTCEDVINHLEKFPNTFCKESNEPVLQCTSDRFGLGVCSRDDNKHGMPDEYQFFQTNDKSEMMKDCPIIRPFQGTMCETGNATLMPGSIVDKMSRCLDVKDLEFTDAAKKGDGVKVQGICAKVECDNVNKMVKLQYKGQSDKETWHVCKSEGGTIVLGGSEFKSGTIVCPKFEEVCTGLKETDLPSIKYEEVDLPEDKVEKPKEKPTEESSSGEESKPNNGAGANAEVQTSTNNQGESASAAPGGNGSSQDSSTTTQGDSTDTRGAEEKQQHEERKTRNRRHISGDATDGSQSTSNTNGAEDAIQSQNTVLKGTTFTESEIKEETLKHANVTVMFGTDSSIMVSYMAPLALLVCVVGFVMVP